MVKYPIQLVHQQRMYDVRAWILEGYMALLVAGYCLVPVLQKTQYLVDGSLQFPTSFTAVAQQYFHFVPQYVLTADTTVPLWYVLTTLISDMAVFGFGAVILGCLVTLQFPHRYAMSSSKPLILSLMPWMTVIQFSCALLCIQPFILSVSVAAWLGLMGGHTIAILYQELMANPREKASTIFRRFFYVDEKSQSTEGADDSL